MVLLYLKFYCSLKYFHLFLAIHLFLNIITEKRIYFTTIYYGVDDVDKWRNVG